MDANIINSKVEALADGIVLSHAMEAKGNITGDVAEWLSQKDVVNNALSFSIRTYKALQKANASEADLDFWAAVFWCISQKYMI
jgi:hypothetical protein